MNIGQRIDEVRKELGLTKTQIWKPSGLTSGVYSQWLNGMDLNGENLIKVAKILGVNPQWLLNGKGDKYTLIPISRLEANEDDYLSNTISLPILNIHGSMGKGSEMDIHQELVVEVLRVSKAWVDKALGPITSMDNLAFIHAIGDSMMPTFNDGDILLVDSGVKNVSSDSVYVLEAYNRLFIKRVRRRLDGAFEISSDNPAVKTVDILNGDSDVTIKGRVVWVWNGKRI